MHSNLAAISENPLLGDPGLHHPHIGNNRFPLQNGGNARLNRLGMKHQTPSQLKIGRGVNDPLHHRILHCGKIMRSQFLGNHLKAQALDLLRLHRERFKFRTKFHIYPSFLFLMSISLN
ncbi:hypothetical protein D3C75_1013110 [compost metagenome]